MGRIATAQLADLVEITPGDEILDAGSGIGGTARYVAERSRCHVVAVDLTEEYCAAARWLNRLVGLDDRITVRQGDVTDLPFGDATFTLRACRARPARALRPGWCGWRCRGRSGRHLGVAAAAAGQVPLGHELPVGLYDNAARDTQFGCQGAGRR